MKKKLQHGCFIDDFVKLLRTHFLKNNSMWLLLHCVRSHPAIACSKLTMETLEQRFEICSKLTIKPPKRRRWCRFGGFIINLHRFGSFFVNVEQISNLCSSVSIVNFEKVNSGCKVSVLAVSLACVFPHLYWIWRDTEYLSVFGPNGGKYDQKNYQYTPS